MDDQIGVDAIAQIRSHPHFTQLPIIALTAADSNQDGEIFLTAGANDYLSKPVKLKQLGSKIQEYSGRGNPPPNPPRGE
jgi:CheY-like chemotaxis protein